MSYHRQKVEILLDRESALYRRIAAKAASEGVAIEVMVEMLMNLGAARGLEKQLDRMEGRK